MADFGGSFEGNSYGGNTCSYGGNSFGGSNLDPSGLRLVDTTELLVPLPGGNQPEASAVTMDTEDFVEADFVEAYFEENASTGFPAAGYVVNYMIVCFLY